MSLNKKVFQRNSFSRAHLAVFVLVFGLIGIMLWRSFAAPNPNLPGDLNGDNTVNISDLSILLSDFNTSNAAADINADGTVNVLDLSILLSHFGQSIGSVPAIPTGLAATPGDGSVSLQWNANPSGDNVDTYQVYWTTDSTWNSGINQNLSVSGTSYTVSGLTNGTPYYFKVSAHNSAGYGSWSATAVSATPQSSGGGGSGSCPSGNTNWCNATNFATPSFTPTRTVDVSSQSAFMTAWSNIQPGDQINVHGVTFTGEVDLTGKQLSNWAQISFDSATKFTGPSSATNDSAVYLQNDSHIRFYGGDISDSNSGDQAGVGLLVHGNVTYVTWWNFVVHDTGNTGIGVWPAEAPSNNLDFKGEVYSWGHNLAWDPHAEKGTGEHGINISDAAYPLSNSRFAIYAHDGPTGAGLEIGTDSGSSSTGITIYVWCQNLSEVATQQTGGNCVNVWGDDTLNNTFEYIEAENLQGRPYDTNGLGGGQSLSSDTVVYGRASNTNQNSQLDGGSLKGVKWDTRGGTTFQDVSPLP